MPIQFTCTNCSNILKVPDEHAGKNARCPSCSAIVSIPDESDVGSEAVGSDEPDSSSIDFSSGSEPTLGNPDSPMTSDNPYAAPAASIAKPAKSQSVEAGTGQPRSVELGEIFELSWKIWQQHIGLLIGSFAILWGISIVLEFVGQFLTFAAGNVDPGLAIAAEMGFGIFSNLVNMFLGIGLAKVCLALGRGKNAEIGMLFSGGDRFLPVLGASIVLGLAMGVAGLLLVGVPALIGGRDLGPIFAIAGVAVLIALFVLVFLRIWGYYYLIVDGQSGVMSCFSDAAEFGKINKATTFLLWLASMGIALLGLLAFCVGLIVAAPLIAMLWAVAYLKMSGQIR